MTNARALTAVMVAAFLTACGSSVQNARTNAQRSTAQSTAVQNLGPLFPNAPQGLAIMVDETPNLWFIELTGAPTAAGGNGAAIRNEKQVFRNEARERGATYREVRSFEKLFNGFSVRVSRGELAKLSTIPGVANVHPVLSIPIPETVSGTAGPDMATAVGMTGADVVQAGGNTGAGIKVAIVDSGIDLDHPAFGGRIVAGYDFVGDAFTGSNEPAPGKDTPDDCNGHGTHVAGIVAADGNVNGAPLKGVAPAALLGAYRVFGCDGSTSSDIILAAMERALDDGMQVLNMSIGAAFWSWPNYPTALAASRLADKGVVVVASIGNSGANGVFAAGAPGVGEKVIGVASYDNTQVVLPVFQVSPDGQNIGYQTATGAPPPPVSGSSPMGRTGTTASTSDGCVALPAGSLSGKTALIRRGACSFYLKALNAQNAGAAGVVLYNHLAGRITPTVAPPTASDPSVTIPVVSITAADGALIDSRIATGAVTMTWTNAGDSFPNPTGRLISSFSSYGLAADLSLKPDLGAPGGLIQSTWPGGGYNTISGTSMSSPHVAGAAVLMLKAKPEMEPMQVRTALQNTAEPKNWSGVPGLGFLDFAHRQGAGMINIPNAIATTTVIEPSKISFGEFEPGSGAKGATLTIRNTGSTARTYSLSHAPALSTGGLTNSPSAFTGFASVTFSPASVEVPAGGTATVSVSITPNSGLLDRSQFGGYLVATTDEGSKVASVPYAGFKGDYQSIQALVPTANSFPRLAAFTGLDAAGAPTYAFRAGGAFTLKNGDIPYMLVHFEHQASLVEARVVDAASGQSHPVFDDDSWFRIEEIARNSTASGFFAFAWDGTRIHSNGANGKGNTNEVYKAVRDGRYKMELRVLKALGNPGNPAHWEEWTSPVFEIRRGG